jgi:hypothetical protein
MPYYRKHTEQDYELPKFVHLAVDYIRIDDVVIRYHGVNKSQLQWIHKNAMGWIHHTSHGDNREWVEAIMTMFQQRLNDFCENSKPEKSGE